MNESKHRKKISDFNKKSRYLCISLCFEPEAVLVTLILLCKNDILLNKKDRRFCKCFLYDIS